MASTSEMRAAWAPACDSGGMETISFGDAGARVTVDRLTVPIWRAVEAIFAKYRYTIRRSDTGAYNCRPITGGSNYSLHAYGIAADINWDTNPYGPVLVTDMPPAMVADIEAIRTVSGATVFRWGGRYPRNKDAMHYEIVATPAELATGIRGIAAPVAPGRPTKVPDPSRPPARKEAPVPLIVQAVPSGTLWALDAVSRRNVTQAEAKFYVELGIARFGPDGKPAQMPKAWVETVPEVRG